MWVHFIYLICCGVKPLKVRVPRAFGRSREALPWKVEEEQGPHVNKSTSVVLFGEKSQWAMVGTHSLGCSLISNKTKQNKSPQATCV